MLQTVLPTKPLGETAAAAFDFGAQLPLGQTILSADVEVAVYAGEDPVPSDMLSGSPAISGGVVTQLLTAGVLGVTYVVTCLATFSGGQILTMFGYLVVAPQQ